LDLLAEVGYSRLTIEGVAARAHVGKTTIYRYWRTKPSLVGEAMAKHLNLDTVPDRGDSREELVDVLRSTMQNFTTSWAGKVIPALAADVSSDPEGGAGFREWFLKPRRATSLEVVQRVVDRGDLPPDTDCEQLCDIWAGTIFYRSLISAMPVDEELIYDLVDLVLKGIVPRLHPAFGPDES